MARSIHEKVPGKNSTSLLTCAAASTLCAHTPRCVEDPATTPPWVRRTNPVPPPQGQNRAYCLSPLGATGVRQHAKGDLARTNAPGFAGRTPSPLRRDKQSVIVCSPRGNRRAPARQGGSRSHQRPPGFAGRTPSPLRRDKQSVIVCSPSGEQACASTPRGIREHAVNHNCAVLHSVAPTSHDKSCCPDTAPRRGSGVGVQWIQSPQISQWGLVRVPR